MACHRRLAHRGGHPGRQRSAARSHRHPLLGADWTQVPHGSHHRTPPRKHRGRHRADLPSHRHAGRTLPGPPLCLPRSPQPQRVSACQPAAERPVKRPAHRTFGLPQLRGTHGVLPAAADRLGRGPGGGRCCPSPRWSPLGRPRGGGPPEPPGEVERHQWSGQPAVHLLGEGAQMLPVRSPASTWPVGMHR